MKKISFKGYTIKIRALKSGLYRWTVRGIGKDKAATERQARIAAKKAIRKAA